MSAFVSAGRAAVGRGTVVGMVEGDSDKDEEEREEEGGISTPVI